MSFVKWPMGLLLALALVGCGDMMDDINPSSNDQREAVTAGTEGYMPGQLARDFVLTDINNQTFTLSDYLAGGSDPADAVVLYFTMWCPICEAHSGHMLNLVIPKFANRGTTRYVLVDYVSGSVAYTAAQALSTGYASGYALTVFDVLADVDQKVFDQLNAAMGSVVVIGPDRTILLNEDYKNGTKLISVLDGLLP